MVTSARVRNAVVAGVGTAAWYATPDVVRSRTARGWVKVACLAVVVAAGVPDARRAWQESREQASVVPDRPRAAEEAVSLRDLPAPARAVAVGVAVAGVGATVAVSAVTERWLFRRGEVRRAAGDAWAHTRTGLVVGALATVVGLLPDPEGDGR